MDPNNRNDEFKTARTHRMNPAGRIYKQGGDHRKNAAERKNDLRAREVENSQLVGLEPGAVTWMIALCLFLFAPFLTDTVLLYPAVADLLKNNLGLTDSASKVIFTIGFVAAQVFAVWGLARFGRGKRGFTGFLLLATGLVIAVATPVITLSTALAQSTVSNVKPPFDVAGMSLNLTMPATEPSLLEAIKGNLHLIMLAVFSLGFHSLIWGFANDIAVAFEAMPILWLNHRDRATIKYELRRADECDREAATILETLFTQDEILSNRYGNVRFIREPLDPRIIEWYDAWKCRKRDYPDKNDPQSGAVA
jgi:hypothetical protein